MPRDVTIEVYRLDGGSDVTAIEERNDNPMLAHRTPANDACGPATAMRDAVA